MKKILRIAPVAFALCAGVQFTSPGRAQSAPQIGEERFLFIFDTSAEMKRRQTAVQTELTQLLATSMGGQLHAGDSIGVWTFGQDLSITPFPQLRWLPEDAVTIASEINKFVGKQGFTGKTRFSALQPRLNQVIQGSGRLTVLIFSDGGDDINWTPYDPGINQVFKQRAAEQKNTRQPFVLVLRTQLGQYTGCTMNFPPGMVSIPEFPPLPAPPAPPPPPKPEPAAPTNVPPVTPTNIVPVAPTNPVEPPPPVKPKPTIQTNEAPAPPVIPVPLTNSIPSPPKPVSTTTPAPAPPTNAVVVPPENSSPARMVAFAIGGALLLAAGGLVALAVIRGRRIDRSSLITRSMRKD